MSINIKELRIGNYCQNSKGDIIKISKLVDETADKEIRGWQLNNSPFGSSNDSVKPILLTKEILIKFDWQYVQEVFGYADKLHVIFELGNGEWEFHPFCTNDKDCHIIIQYAHQLQNLCYAFNKQELTINN